MDRPPEAPPTVSQAVQDLATAVDGLTDAVLIIGILKRQYTNQELNDAAAIAQQIKRGEVA